MHSTILQNLRKKLVKASKKKGCDDLQLWIPSIVNHLWWCCKNCEGDASILEQKMLGALYHTTGVHSWHGSKIFAKVRQCSHPPLCEDKQCNIKWLEQDGPSHEELERILMNTRFRKSLPKLTRFQHTGALESFHSLILKYAPKRQHFAYAMQRCRLTIAAIHWNSNVKRAVKRDSEGNPVMDSLFSRGSAKRVVRQRYEPVNTTFRQDLLSSICRHRITCTDDSAKETLRREIPAAARVSLGPEFCAEKKDLLIMEHKSRF